MGEYVIDPGGCVCIPTSSHRKEPDKNRYVWNDTCSNWMELDQGRYVWNESPDLGVDVCDPTARLRIEHQVTRRVYDENKS